jgi:hypothetical protein
LALEESEKRFEYRLQMLEAKEKHLGLRSMKPDQQTSASFMQRDSISDDRDYKSLYLSLLQDYNILQSELKEKDQKIRDLLSQAPKQEEEEETSFREEDGYLLFDTTTMNGDITHCRVKIPTPPPNYYLASPPATRVSSPQHHHRNNRSLKKGLNPNAPEWRKRK